MALDRILFLQAQKMNTDTLAHFGKMVPLEVPCLVWKGGGGLRWPGDYHDAWWEGSPGGGLVNGWLA